jgi:hypothetical protein
MAVYTVLLSNSPTTFPFDAVDHKLHCVAYVNTALFQPVLIRQICQNLKAQTLWDKAMLICKYTRAPVSTDSVYAVLVIRGLPQLKKNGKLKK